VRLKLVLIITAAIALPIAAQAGNNKMASGHKVKAALGKTKGQSAVDEPEVETPIDSYSETVNNTHPRGDACARTIRGAALFLMCIACSLDLSMGSNKGDDGFRQGRECLIPFGGKRCPVKHCAAPTATNCLHLLHAE
jgi:hypothetical protein